MPTDFKQLLEKYLLHKITAEEKRKLFEMLRSGDYGKELAAIIDEQLAAGDFTIDENDETRELIFEKIQRSRKGKVRKMFWSRVAVAASIILIVGLGIVISKELATERSHLPIAKTQDIEAPKETKATILLADGRKVTVDSLTSLAQGKVKLIKNEKGEVIYNGSQLEANSSQLVYNTLTNPRGSKVVSLTLSDGTKVWLNSESSLKYPVAFVGNERRVEITGEAYFEVAHIARPSIAPGFNPGKNEAMPFIVSKGDMQVEVLGTHFNVNAYNDEADIKVTLLEGSVNVIARSGATKQSQSAIIKPGQQAVVSASTLSMTTNENADLQQAVAWKDGLFYFKNSAVPSIMRQIARWYDVDVSYESIPDEILNGTIPRTVSVSNVFKILEATGKVHFKIDGRKITVSKTNG